MIHKIIFSLGLIFGLYILLLTNTSIYAATPLNNIFNIFGSGCVAGDHPGQRTEVGSDIFYLGGGEANERAESIGAWGTVVKVRPCIDGSLPLLDRLIVLLMWLGPPVAAVVLLYSSIQYYTSSFSGDAGAARKTLVAAATGLVVIVAVPTIYKTALSLTTEYPQRSIFEFIVVQIVENLFQPLVQNGIVLGAAFSVLSIIYGGYQYAFISAKKGQEVLRNGLIGLGITIGAVAIVALVQQIIRFITSVGPIS